MQDLPRDDGDGEEVNRVHWGKLIHYQVGKEKAQAEFLVLGDFWLTKEREAEARDYVRSWVADRGISERP